MEEPAPFARRTWYLSSVNLFRGLPDAQIEAWARTCGTRAWPAGQRIIDGRTSLPEQVLVVKEGAVRLLLDARGGRTETVDILGPGQLFGVSMAFGATPVGLHADALGDVLVCVTDGRAFLAALASDPEIILNLVRQVGANVVQVDGRYGPPPALPAPVRLSAVLGRLATTAGKAESGKGWRLPDCVSRTTLAHQVGCTRETVARLLAELEADGRVRRQGRAIFVNLERLEQRSAASRRDVM